MEDESGEEETIFEEKVTLKEKLILRESIDLDVCQAENCWSDMGFWEYIPVAGKSGRNESYIVALDAYTGISKQRLAGYGRAALPPSLQVMFSAVFADDNFLDMTWLYHVSDVCEVTSNVPVIKVGPDGPPPLPKLEVSLEGPATIAAGGEAELEIVCRFGGRAAERPVTFYLTKVNGYLPVERIQITGRGKIKAQALGLAPGDEMEVKLGYKFWTNAAAKRLEVV